MNDLEELARSRALNDPVIIGAGEGDDLADAEVNECFLTRALELCRVVEGTGTDDAALALHEARHRVIGANSARVGQ
ncbi:unannotated protein [freshwater metagenome]|uniref:Unannotated protein n=1 Tax=freshwater metagenome TaxID=449393 RepID=A0A6J7G1M6_9ZZZZ